MPEDAEPLLSSGQVAKRLGVVPSSYRPLGSCRPAHADVCAARQAVPLPLVRSGSAATRLAARGWRRRVTRAAFLIHGARRCLTVSGNERTQVATDTLRYTSTMIERSGPAVRAALLRYSSAEECAQFEAELRSALARAAEDLDLSGPLEVLAHWHALATSDANPFTGEEREQIERMKAGDYTGLHTRDEHGNWVRL